MIVPPGFVAARAARAYITHLLPAEDGKVTSHTARCGWKAKPAGRAPVRWYQPHAKDPRLCPACFVETRARTTTDSALIVMHRAWSNLHTTPTAREPGITIDMLRAITDVQELVNAAVAAAESLRHAGHVLHADRLEAAARDVGEFQ